jgi:hypothetical protein
MSRRRGSATALKASEVVEARGMNPIYSHMGICQALFLGGGLAGVLKVVARGDVLVLLICPTDVAVESALRPRL